MKLVTVDELRRWQREKKGFLFLNVLDRETFAAGHAAGSRNVPLDGPDFEGRVAQLAGGKARPVVVYCAGPTCDASTRAARRLEAVGFTNVHDFKGGLQEWREAGGSVESAEKPIDR